MLPNHSINQIETQSIEDIEVIKPEDIHLIRLMYLLLCLDTPIRIKNQDLILRTISIQYTNSILFQKALPSDLTINRHREETQIADTLPEEEIQEPKLRELGKTDP